MKKQTPQNWAAHSWRMLDLYLDAGFYLLCMSCPQFVHSMFEEFGIESRRVHSASLSAFSNCVGQELDDYTILDPDPVLLRGIHAVF